MTARHPPLQISPLWGLFALLAITVAGTLSSLAFLTDQDEATNQLSISQIDLKIEEDFDVPDSHEVPSSYQKVVTVHNTGTGDAYARVNVAFSEGAVTDFLSLNFDETTWWGPDELGYWYYRLPLKPSEATSPLFTTVTVTGTPEGGWKDYDIIIYAEEAQALDARTGQYYPTPQQAFFALEGD